MGCVFAGQAVKSTHPQADFPHRAHPFGSCLRFFLALTCALAMFPLMSLMIDEYLDALGKITGGLQRRRRQHALRRHRQ